MALTDTDFSINETKYRVNKLPAMSGYRLLMKIIRETGKSLRSPEYTPINMDQDGTELMINIAAVVATLPEDFVMEIERSMFAAVQFENSPGNWITLDTNEGLAFKEPMDGLEVLVRALSVNFSGSLTQKIVDAISEQNTNLPQSR